MERDRLIDRKVYPVVPPMVEYSLTPMGRLFIEPIEMLYTWAAKHDDALSKLRRRRKKHTASRQNRKREIDVCVFVSILLATSMSDDGGDDRCNWHAAYRRLAWRIRLL
jgi:hypothetical protein